MAYNHLINISKRCRRRDKQCVAFLKHGKEVTMCALKELTPTGTVEKIIIKPIKNIYVNSTLTIMATVSISLHQFISNLEVLTSKCSSDTHQLAITACTCNWSSVVSNLRSHPPGGLRGPKRAQKFVVKNGVA